MKRPLFDLWQLICVRSIAEKGSIHAAAEFLNVRQSTVSRSLLALEKRLNVALFVRSTLGTTPTTFGNDFIRRSDVVLADVSAMNTLAQRFRAGQTGQLIVGLQNCIVPGRFSSLAADFQRDHPDITFQYSEGGPNHLLYGLEQGKLDVVIITRCDIKASLQFMPLWTDKILVALPADHTLSVEAELSWEDLRNEIFLMGRDNAGEDFTAMIARKFGEPWRQPKIRHHDVGSIRILTLVAKGDGVALISSSWLPLIHKQEKKELTLIELRDADGASHLEFVIVWRSGNNSRIASDFIDYVEARFEA